MLIFTKLREIIKEQKVTDSYPVNFIGFLLRREINFPGSSLMTSKTAEGMKVFHEIF